MQESLLGRNYLNADAENFCHETSPSENKLDSAAMLKKKIKAEDLGWSSVFIDNNSNEKKLAQMAYLENSNAKLNKDNDSLKNIVIFYSGSFDIFENQFDMYEMYLKGASNYGHPGSNNLKELFVNITKIVKDIKKMRGNERYKELIF